jgi:hypothetical protein
MNHLIVLEVALCGYKKYIQDVILNWKSIKKHMEKINRHGKGLHHMKVGSMENSATYRFHV